MIFSVPIPASLPDAPMPGGALMVLPLTGIPEVRAGDDLAALLVQALSRAGGVRDGDVLAVSSKVVSKAAGLRVPAEERPEAFRSATRRVVAERRTPTGVAQVVEAAAGPVMAAAGIDASNTGPDGGVLLLPDDPDHEAERLRTAVLALLPGVEDLGVLLTDTAGRPWRAGQTDLALGAAGLAVLEDLRGGTDADGRDLAVTARAVADELAAAADLVKGKAERVPAALLRGGPARLTADPGAPAARTLVRTGPSDWFALGHREALRTALGAPPGSPQAERVGLPSVLPESAAERCGRAVRLALLGQPARPATAAVTITGSVEEGLQVLGPDPVLAGRVAGRLEVALASEDLTVPVEVRVG